MRIFSFNPRLLLLLLTLGMAQPVLAQEDAIVRYFREYAESEDFSSVYISGTMLKLLGKSDTRPEETELRASFNRLAGLRILASDSLPDGMRYYRDFVSTLQRQSYEELMRVQDPEEKVLFLIRHGADGETIEELLMLVGSTHQFFMLSIIGEIDLDAIARLAEGMEIEGMESLGRIKEHSKQH